MQKAYLKAVYFIGGLVGLTALLLLHSLAFSNTNNQISVFNTPSVVFSTQQDYYRSLAPSENMQIHPSLPSGSFLEVVRK